LLFVLYGAQRIGEVRAKGADARGNEKKGEIFLYVSAKRGGGTEPTSWEKDG